MLRILVICILSFAVYLSAAPAQALLIVIDFTVRAADDDVSNAGATSNGSFSFDSGLVPAGSFLLTGSAVGSTDPSLSWDGTIWSEQNSGVDFLQSDGAGTLVGWVFGGDPAGIFALDLSGAVDDFFISSVGTFSYARAGGGRFSGSLHSWTTRTLDQLVVQAAVPEAASWALFMAGLLGIGGVARRIHPKAGRP